MATLAAATFEFQGTRIPVSGVYTFGQPRIANKKFTKKYNAKLKKRTFRCVNDDDVVTRLPPQAFGYSHVGKLLYFDNKGKLRRDNQLSWWGKFWDRLEDKFEDVFDLPLDELTDHSMDRYQKLAQKARK